jgi:hypothetical protein
MKFTNFVFTTLLIFNFLNADVIKNPDKPTKGQWQFSPTKRWETDCAGDDILVEISCLILADDGNTYALDSRQNKIHVFNSQGKHKLSIGRKGEGPGEIKEAYRFYINKKMVIVPDGTKIHYFTVEGEYKKSIKTPEMLMNYLFLDENRTIAIPFSSVVLRDKTKPREVFLYNLSTGEKTKLFEVPRVKALRYAGGGMRFMLRMPDIVHEELFMDKNRQGFVYGYSSKYILHQLNSTGKAARTITLENRARQPVALEDKKIIVKNAMAQHKNIPKHVIEGVADQIPGVLPYFHQIHTEHNGHIYILTASIKNTSQRDVDIFSEKGKYLYRGRISLDNNYTILSIGIKGNNLVAFVDDEEEERKLVGFTINNPK